MQELHCRPLFQADPLDQKAVKVCQEQYLNRLETKQENLNNDTKNLHKILPSQNHDSSNLWSLGPSKHEINTPSITYNKFFKPEYLQLFGFIGVGAAGMIMLIQFLKNTFYHN
jgi:hypothetical protein